MISHNFYEPHTHQDPSFPIIFHLDIREKYESDFLPHWHENIEILYILEGTITVLSDASSITANKDEIIIINSNNVHHIQTLVDMSKYYCLIIDRKFCEEFGLYTEEIIFQRLIKDKLVRDKFNAIKVEFILQKAFYKAEIKSQIIDLMICLYRDYTLSESPFSNKLETNKIEIIKKAIRYIQSNYDKNISISDIAEEAGISKYYFCRIFKEITDCSTVRFINILRCSNAKKLLQSGKYSVEEAAHICGFDNLSYFSKTYKKHMGCLPSSTKQAI
ncbi:MAG: transcriptional regulator, AraC family [Herbinix sp.]|jgi:AraC-like DNA-binding protein|nr:transcriptional regulator, AraC family [Herbinix sp.]